jgi:molybdopterin molybdotransferase
MTGAAVPPGADAVVMVEHARLADGRVTFERAAERGQNIVQRGREARAGQELLPIRTRLGVAEMAVAAQVGAHQVSVYARPRVAVLSTGDEIVDIEATPGPLQIRGSNGLALETLVELGGGEAVSLGNARDDRDDLRRRIERGLSEADMLVISGGVSKGKYDLVEDVLSELGAEFFFDAVAIRPGQPAVFGRCAGKPVLGLPGNPISSMVTFELFAQPAMDILSGALVQPQLMLRARVAKAVRERGTLTRFLPAQVRQSAAGEPEVSVLPWQGSGDLVALASANAFLVVPPEKSDLEVGEWAMVLLRRGYGGEWC